MDTAVGWSNSVTCACDSDLSVSSVEVIGQGLMAIQSSQMVIYNYAYTVLIRLLYWPQHSQDQGEVQSNCSWGCHLAKALTGCQGLAGSALQDGGVPPEH